MPSADGGTRLLISSDSRFLFVPVTGSHVAKYGTERVVTPAQTTWYTNGPLGVASCPEVILQPRTSAPLARAWGVSETPRWRYDTHAGTFNPSRHQDPLPMLAPAKGGGKTVSALRRLRGACLSLDLAAIQVLVNAGVRWCRGLCEHSDPAPPSFCWWAPTELLFHNEAVGLSLPEVHASWVSTLNAPVSPALRPLVTAALNVFLEYALDQTKSASPNPPAASPASSRTIGGHSWHDLSVRVRVLRDAMLDGVSVRVLRFMSTPTINGTTLGRVIVKHCRAASEVNTWNWPAATALRTALWAYHTGRLEAACALLALIPSGDASHAKRSLPRSELQWLWLPVSAAPNCPQSAATAATDWAVVRSLLRACIASKRLVKIPECLQFLAADADCMDILVGESPHASRLLRGSTSSFAPSIAPAVSTAVTAACDRRRQVLEESLRPYLDPVAQLILVYDSI
jgi:hypothetical protein